MSEEALQIAVEDEAVPPPANFVHLHVHSQYSLLEGTLRVSDLVRQAKEWNMPAVALTDSNNLFGSVDFYCSAKEAGIKPILGCEIFYTPDMAWSVQKASQPPQATRVIEPYYFHLVLLCKTHQGYQNLCQLVTRAYAEKPPADKRAAQQLPRGIVTRAMLDQWGDDLIVLSTGVRGPFGYSLLQGQTEQVEQSMDWFKERFGEDFYLELQDTGIPEQDALNDLYFELGKKHGIECVATTDAHYLKPEDAESQEVLQCIERGKNLDIDRPTSLVPKQFYFKSPKEIRENMARFESAVANTLKVAEKCNVEFKFEDDEGKPIYHLPNFRPTGSENDPNFDLVEYFRSETTAGLKRRFASPQFAEKIKAQDWSEKEYWDRLEFELSMIERTGFAGYFLIVSDFIRWSKKEGIPVGPGRGSGAGSLVAYSLEITDLDPIEYSLLFERFINPERISMPDFDVDFCQDRRGEVIEYVTQKYGQENVCQIITFGKLQARAVVKDVGRVLGLSFAETDRITKLFPDEINIKLKDAYEREPMLREAIAEDTRLAKLWEYSVKLEGLFRNCGVHAAGVIITENPVVSYCPLYSGSEGVIVTQLDKDFSEKIGLVKFDFLGLKTLTVIDNAVKFVRETAPEGSELKKFVIDEIPLDDKPVFDLIGSGDTDGVFQVESSGMKDLCSRLLPNSIGDLTAINALYRPGPLGSGMVDDFIDRKHGRQEIVYEVPALESILADTYGVILYQEQVMQIARELAGYSLGQADMLRRAMGKKKAEEMARHREIFNKGAVERNYDPKKADGIFDLMAKFAEYGFNKSHSAAYALLTYQTAYLKTHFPAQFMAALMTTEMSNTDKITKYIADARSHKIPVLPPDINLSQARFSVEKIFPDSSHYPLGEKSEFVYGVRFGLEAIKGVGGAAVLTIIEARESTDTEKGRTGPFKDTLDFFKRVSTRKVNKKVVESLTLAGAMDSISEANRASLFASLEKLLSFASDEQAERELGQSSLFDAFEEDQIKLVTPTESLMVQMEDWPQAQKLSKEKSVVGFYVSGHPMDQWQSVCDQWLGWNSQKLRDWIEEQKKSQAAQPKQEQWGAAQGGRFRRAPRPNIQMAGLLSELKEITTKKGSRMAFGVFEDLYGKVEIIFFPDAFNSLQERIKQAMSQAQSILVSGEIDSKEETPKIFASSIESIEEAYQARAKSLFLKVNPSQITPEHLRELKQRLIRHRGSCGVTLCFANERFKTVMELPENYKVDGSPELVTAVNQIFGSAVVELR